MNCKVSNPQWNWTQIESGAYEAYGQHAYWQARRNAVLKKWALGRRLGGADRPIQLVGLYPTLTEAKAVAERREAAL